MQFSKFPLVKSWHLRPIFYFTLVFFLVATEATAHKLRPHKERSDGVIEMRAAQYKCLPVDDFKTINTRLPDEFGEKRPRICLNWAKCDWPDPKQPDTQYFVVACFPVDGRCPDFITCSNNALDKPEIIVPDYIPIPEDKPLPGQNYKLKVKEGLPKKAAIFDNFPPPDGKKEFCSIHVEIDPPDPRLPKIVSCAANRKGDDYTCPGIYKCMNERFDWEPAAMASLPTKSDAQLSTLPRESKPHRKSSSPRSIPKPPSEKDQHI